MRHPHYDGRKAESVGSVGSRLFGVVKASYGKPRLKLKDMPVNQCREQLTGSDDLGAIGIGAKSPYRQTRQEKQNIVILSQLARHAHKTNRKHGKSKPRLVKH